MIHRCLDISAHVTTRPSSRQLGSDFETTRPMCRDRSAPGLKQLGPGVEIYSNALMIAYVERCIIIMYVYVIIYIYYYLLLANGTKISSWRVFFYSGHQLSNTF